MELPQPVEELFAMAVEEATNSKSEAVEPAHLFVAACKLHAPLQRALQAAAKDPTVLRRKVRSLAYPSAPEVKEAPGRISGRVWRVLEFAAGHAEALKGPLTADGVVISLLRRLDSALARVFELEDLVVSDLIDHLRRANTDGDNQPHGLTPARGNHPKTPTIDRYARDYTALAMDGRLDPVIGRRDEIKQVIRILLQKQKNNPVLIGDAGVGKTSIVEGLAREIATEDSVVEIRNWRIVEVVLSSLVAGTKYRGEFEERLEQVIKEAEADEQLILFLDELHTVVGAGSASGSLDAANILKPALARGRLRLIGATTPDEYRRHVEKDAALERRFQPVRVDEPTPDETREILTKLREIYEAHHQVEITDQAIVAAVELSVRYLPDRRLPDKARDLIDRAAVNKRFLTLSPNKNPSVDDKRVTREDVARVIAQWVGIPAERLAADQQQRLLEMEDALRQRVIGQDEAVQAVAQTVRTALSGLADPRRPLGVFLFTGPTGVGKTELAKALAEFLFADEKHLIRFDMSEYMEEHSVSKLLGAPPGYVGHEEGGALIEAVRRNPYCVVLFDEAEKAHPRIADVMLQIFDDGRLSDAQGRSGDFRHAIIILTTNLRSTDERKPVQGFHREGADAAPEERPSPSEVRKLLLTRFRPELVNRLSHVIAFNSLGQDELRGIVDKLIARVQQRMSDKGLDLKPAASVCEALLKLGYQAEWGARELERVIEQKIVQPLAQHLLKGDFKAGDVIHVVADGDEVSFTTTAEPPPPFAPSTAGES